MSQPAFSSSGTQPSAADFQYEAPINEHQLRILELEPAADVDAQVKCKLKAFARNECDKRHKYEALSYCWGEPQPMTTIEINGLDFEIRPNLASALRYLRFPDISRHLWIDAICIDQDEQNKSAEKDLQVKLMDETYKRASKVIVWLGEPSEEKHSSLAMKAIDFFGQECGQKPLKEVRGLTITLQDCIAGHGPEVYLLASRNLLQRDWFKRLWVIQEVCLAPADSVTMVCGSDSTSFWRFANLQLVKLDPEKLNLTEEKMRAVINDCGVFEFIAGAQETPLVLIRQFFATKPDDGPNIEGVKEKTCALLTHLWAFRDRGCTKAHDKVYALRSLALDLPPKDNSDPDKDDPDYNIDPNYKEDVGTTYAKATRAIIKKHGKLDVLGMCLVPEGREPGAAARPSWAPDLELEARHRPLTPLTMFISGHPPYFTTTSNSNTTPDFSDDLSELRVQGYRVGTITALGFENAKDWIEAVRHSRKLTEQLASERYADTTDAFWRTLITNRTSQSTPARPDVEGRQFPVWWKVLTEKEKHKHADFIHYQTAFIQHFPNRSFFVTKEGYIGLGPASIQKDDSVCLLAGGQVPFALRRTNEQNERYQVIGECYVHELMNGSLWDQFETECNHSTKKVWFVLI